MENSASAHEGLAAPKDLVTRLSAEFARAKGFVFTQDLFTDDFIEELYDEACVLEGLVNRKFIPFYKKSGSVSCLQMHDDAPTILELYHSPVFRGLLESIIGVSLQTCPDTDAHACAIYYYTQAGDHIGFHYDTSHYRGSRFTVLIGLYDDSEGCLVCRIGEDRDDDSQELRLPTPPGLCVIFDGNALYHGVSPIGPGQRRVVLSLEYVTDRRMSRWWRFVSRLKDAFAYFGFRQIFVKSRRM
jgi:hypothetical protein